MNKLNKNDSNSNQVLTLPVTGDIKLKEAAIMWNPPKESGRQIAGYAGQLTVTTLPQDETSNIKFLRCSSGACWAAWREEGDKDKLLSYLMNVMMELITNEKFHFNDVDEAFNVIPEYREIRDNDLSSIFK